MAHASELLEQLPLPVLVYRLDDRDDDHTLRLTSANRSAWNLLQQPPEELTGRYIDDVFPEAREMGLPGRLAEVARSGRPFRSASPHSAAELHSRWSHEAFPLPDQSVGVSVEESGLLTAAETAADLHLGRVRSLHKIDRAILHSLEVDVTLDVFLDQVVEQLAVDAASVLLFQSDRQRLEAVASRGFYRSPTSRFWVRLGEGLPGVVAQSRQAMEIPDLPTEPRFLRAGDYQGEDFVAYYGVPLVAKGALRGVLEVFQRSPLQPDAEWLKFLRALACQAAIAIDNAAMYQRLQCKNAELLRTYDTTLEGLSRALEYRDWETDDHARRVARMCTELAQSMGVEGEALVHIHRGALLHDVGKIGIPDAILRKPGPLTEQEWRVMRTHPRLGYDLLSPIPFLKDALDIPLYHHERWDGRGYPHGLGGTAIPFAARLFAVVDAWDAMNSDRPYRKALAPEEALERLRCDAGSHFDPEVARVFLQTRPDIALNEKQD